MITIFFFLIGKKIFLRNRCFKIRNFYKVFKKQQYMIRDTDDVHITPIFS